MTIADSQILKQSESKKLTLKQSGKEEGTAESKAEVRTRFLALRDALAEQDRTFHSRDIVKKLTSFNCYREAEVLLAYVNYRSEVETLSLIRQAISEHKRVFVPKVTGKDMEFYQITNLDELQAGYRGILEPEEGLSYPVYLAQKDRLPYTLLCMPGAAFDTSRHRIGYGGGFYDRYLEKLGVCQAQNNLPLITVALAYTCQVCEKIPWEPHDIIPDILLTEQGSI